MCDWGGGGGGEDGSSERDRLNDCFMGGSVTSERLGS